MLPRQPAMERKTLGMASTATRAAVRGTEQRVHLQLGRPYRDPPKPRAMRRNVGVFTETPPQATRFELHTNDRGRQRGGSDRNIRTTTDFADKRVRK